MKLYGCNEILICYENVNDSMDYNNCLPYVIAILVTPVIILKNALDARTRPDLPIIRSPWRTTWAGSLPKPLSNVQRPVYDLCIFVFVLMIVSVPGAHLDPF